MWSLSLGWNSAYTSGLFGVWVPRSGHSSPAAPRTPARLFPGSPWCGGESWSLCRISTRWLEELTTVGIFLERRSLLSRPFLLWPGHFYLFLPAAFWHLEMEILSNCSPVGVIESLSFITMPCNMMIRVIIYKAHIKIQSWKGAFKFTEHIKSLVSSWYPLMEFPWQ